MGGGIWVDGTQPTHDQELRMAGKFIGRAGVRNGRRRAGAIKL